MKSKPVKQQESQTAYFTALRRAIAAEEYPETKWGADDLARIFLPAQIRFLIGFKAIRRRVIAKLDYYFPGLYQYIIARTQFFDNLVIEQLKAGIPQIVFLGAGFDSRPCRFANHVTGTKIIEIDALPTQARKQKLLNKARLNLPQGHVFLAADFNHQSLDQILKQAGYNKNKACLFVWEGVSYYLNRHSVEMTLGYIAEEAHKESLLAFDYILPDNQDNRKQFFGAGEFYDSMKAYHSDEGLAFTVPLYELVNFLKTHRLKVEEHLDNEDMERNYLLNEQGRLLGRVTGVFRLVLASNS